jgi:hypothetical protein
MFGLFTGTGDTWIPETRKQGCAWDLRYLYLAGGINTPRPWREVNSPAGQYAFNYMQESERQGLVPVFVWYQLRQSLPGHKEEAPAVKTNLENVDTMRQYFSDIRLFMELSAKFGKPVVFHVEPDTTGFLLTWNQFKPHDPDRILVRVAATGLPELARHPDTLKGFFQAIAGLRDRIAPNVLLAWHASLWGDPPPLKGIADLILASGDWDLIFVDPSDRDVGWKIAHNYALHELWWDDAKFEKWRKWSSQLNQATGLPLIAWQIPIGNTIMAACNNTEGHYMDNRPQYWLEDYPRNPRILEWAQAGYIGLLFGGGAGGCTSFGDSMKDGVTNPAPVKDNKGETSQYADDDGGYLRMRVARYYASPLRFTVAGKAAPRGAEPGKAEAEKKDPPARKAASPEAVAAWDAKLRERIGEELKAGRRPRFRWSALGDWAEVAELGAGGDLKVQGKDGGASLAWASVALEDRRSLALGMLRKERPEDHALAAFYFLATGEPEKAQPHLEKAGPAAEDVKAAFR